MTSRQRQAQTNAPPLLLQYITSPHVRVMKLPPGGQTTRSGLVNPPQKRSVGVKLEGGTSLVDCRRNMSPRSLSHCCVRSRWRFFSCTSCFSRACRRPAAGLQQQPSSAPRSSVCKT